MSQHHYQLLCCPALLCLSYIAGPITPTPSCLCYPHLIPHSVTRRAPHHVPTLSLGELLNCHLHKRYSDPVSYLLLPADLSLEELPHRLAMELVKPKKVYRGEDWEDREGEEQGEGDSEADSDGDTSD